MRCEVWHPWGHPWKQKWLGSHACQKSQISCLKNLHPRVSIATGRKTLIMVILGGLPFLESPTSVDLFPRKRLESAKHTLAFWKVAGLSSINITTLHQSWYKEEWYRKILNAPVTQHDQLPVIWTGSKARVFSGAEREPLGVWQVHAIFRWGGIKGTIWLFNIAIERSTNFKFGKPSISMGHRKNHGELWMS